MSTAGGEDWRGCEGALWEGVLLSGDATSDDVCPYATAVQTTNNQVITMLARTISWLDTRFRIRMPIWSQHVGFIDKDGNSLLLKLSHIALRRSFLILDGNSEQSKLAQKSDWLKSVLCIAIRCRVDCKGIRRGNAICRKIRILTL
jgi:hypothetical protein